MKYFDSAKTSKDLFPNYEEILLEEQIRIDSNRIIEVVQKKLLIPPKEDKKPKENPSRR